MPAERTAMRQVRDVLRLKTAGVAINEIARRVGVASSTVRLTLKASGTESSGLAATAAAASRLNGPANTARRRRITRSGSANNS